MAAEDLAQLRAVVAKDAPRRLQAVAAGLPFQVEEEEMCRRLQSHQSMVVEVEAEDPMRRRRLLLSYRLWWKFLGLRSPPQLLQEEAEEEEKEETCRVLRHLQSQSHLQ